MTNRARWSRRAGRCRLSRQSGELPPGLVNSATQYAHFGGTSLCAPSDQAFLDWPAGVPDANGPPCEP